MSKVCMDIMVVSLTINWCVLCFNLVPVARAHVVKSKRLRRWKHLYRICHYYGQRPMVLAKIVTEQSLVWLLVLFGITAICTTDVVLYPFRYDVTATWQPVFIETLFAVNLGRYIFTIIHRTFMKQYARKVQFRIEIVHHLVTLTCYGLFLAYTQNMLLGLVGLLVESTSIFDEAGRYFKDRDRRHTTQYRGLVVIGCVFTICFRGVIPITFLIVAMFQQTPFAMDYAPLTIFFLSIIFFSVINVWQMLSNIQRLVKNTYEQTQGEYSRQERGDARPSSTGPYHSRGRRLQLSKNNLGYLRAYPNKNIANHFEDEKHNLNNHKEFPKENLELQIRPSILLPATKNELVNKQADEQDRESHISDETSQSRDNVLRASDSSNSSVSSTIVFLPPSQTSALNNNQDTSIRRESDRRLHSRSLSLDTLSVTVMDACQEVTSTGAIQQ